jgi:hypothetical protein
MSCLLAGILFLVTCGRAQPFGDMAMLAPAQHRALVSSVEFTPGNVGWAYPSDGRLILPDLPETWTILHEIGHLVSYSSPRGEQLLAKWKAIFSPSDAPTEYGRSSMYEDFAESYRLALTGELQARDARRNDWMQKYALSETVKT